MVRFDGVNHLAMATGDMDGTIRFRDRSITDALIQIPFVLKEGWEGAFSKNE